MINCCVFLFRMCGALWAWNVPCRRWFGGLALLGANNFLAHEWQIYAPRSLLNVGESISQRTRVCGVTEMGQTHSGECSIRGDPPSASVLPTSILRPHSCVINGQCARCCGLEHFLHTKSTVVEPHLSNTAMTKRQRWPAHFRWAGRSEFIR